MWKIVKGQWVELTEDEKQTRPKEDQMYFKDFSSIMVKTTRIEIKAREEEGQITGWKADINLGGRVAYWTKVYIDQFPDLLVFLRDISNLDKLGH
jgi:hypothetical protein